jgi:ABC-2 type transport system permease protein
VADSLRLYVRYVSIAIRAQLQYRAAFVLKVIGYCIATGVEFLGLWALFARFGTLAGWTLHEVALIYGVADVGFALADGLGRGLDRFGDVLKAGEFDRMLVRPRSAILQLLGFDFRLLTFGRMAQGIVALAWAGQFVAWSPARAALLALSFACTTSLFIGLAVLQATTAFWTIESLEVWNAFTYGGNYASQYPFDIYTRWLRAFFTAILPLALTGYVPARAILGRDPLDAWHVIAPLAGPVFLIIALGAWRIGVRHHASTGS